MERFYDKYKVSGNIFIPDYDADEKLGMGKKEAKAQRGILATEIAGLQEIQWAEQIHKIIFEVEGMDSAGKGGTIKKVFGATNPHGMYVKCFKGPTAEERKHHYLWRFDQALPEPGNIGIWDRTQLGDTIFPWIYKDITVPEVMERCEEIVQWEDKLTDQDYTLIKIFLNIDYDEQGDRFEIRRTDPTKQYKFSMADIEKREQWPEFMEGYSRVLSATSTKRNPWYILPANRKWVRDYLAASIVVDKMRGLDMKYPEPEPGIEDMVVPR
tara:strand:+ start:6627 stop:7433 length:807 start_codon:yes stop_codon:yes gene_type:complete